MFLASTSAALATGVLLQSAHTEEAVEPIIDIHQHTNYAGRTDEKMLKHQRAMGVTTTILLPAGKPVKRASTHNGKSNGLAAKTGGNESVQAMAKRHPKGFLFGANEVPDLPGMQKDPSQKTNIAEAHPEVVKKMRAAYDKFWQEARPLMVNEKAPMSKTRPFHVWFNQQIKNGGIPQWKAPKL